MSQEDVPLERAELLKKAFLGGLAVTGGFLAAGRVDLAGASSPTAGTDLRILNFMLYLEYMMSALYREALKKDALRGELLDFAHTASVHEQRHVEYLQRELGDAARSQPNFDFDDITSDPARFARTAMRLEEAVVGAYVGQGANLTRRKAAQVAQIASVEGRHAAWIRDSLGADPAPRAADPTMSQADVLAALERAGLTKGKS